MPIDGYFPSSATQHLKCHQKSLSAVPLSRIWDLRVSGMSIPPQMELESKWCLFNPAVIPIVDYCWSGEKQDIWSESRAVVSTFLR